jgi:hypothetical protein
MFLSKLPNLTYKNAQFGRKSQIRVDKNGIGLV